MIREVDLVSYLPPYLRNFKELTVTLEAENPEFKIIWDAANRVLYNAFISTADEYGLSRFEKMLNLTPNADDTLENRRFRLIAKYNETIPYTRKKLAEFLQSLCGFDGYQLTVFEKDFLVNVKVAFWAKNQLNAIQNLLGRILPANMRFTVDLLIYPMCFYNQEKLVLDIYGQVSEYQNIGNRLFTSSLFINLKAKQSYSFTGEVLMDNMFCLDGSFRLNGTKKLNATLIKEEL